MAAVCDDVMHTDVAGNMFARVIDTHLKSMASKQSGRSAVNTGMGGNTVKTKTQVIDRQAALGWFVHGAGW